MPNANAAKALGSNEGAAVDKQQANTAAKAGTQFITGTCAKDADCASACCGFRTGKCAGPVIAQERDGGCGFGDAVPNADAARALGSLVKATGVLRRGFVA